MFCKADHMRRAFPMVQMEHRLALNYFSIALSLKDIINLRELTRFSSWDRNIVGIVPAAHSIRSERVVELTIGFGANRILSIDMYVGQVEHFVRWLIVLGNKNYPFVFTEVNIWKIKWLPEFLAIFGVAACCLVRWGSTWRASETQTLHSHGWTLHRTRSVWTELSRTQIPIRTEIVVEF